MSDQQLLSTTSPADGTTLTVNKRLARFLSEQYHQAQLQRGLEAWMEPDILPWSAWLRRSYIQLQSVVDAPLPRILTDLQEQVVWEELVRGGSGAASARLILQPGAAAGLARKAYSLLNQWGLDASEVATGGVPEVRLFKTWAQRFRQRCDSAGWINPASIAGVLGREFANHPERIPVRLKLCGFQQLQPRQAHLLRVLEQAGTGIERALEPPPAGLARRMEFADGDEELSRAASWCRALLEAGESGPIGVVVPDLSRRLHQVEDVFQDLLQPGWWCTAAHGTGQMCNLSLGPPLGEQALVGQALAFLELATGSISLVQASRILLAEHLAGAALERDQRARLDARLRELGETRWSIRRLTALCRNRRATGSPGGARILAERLSRLAQNRPPSRRRPASAWAETFADDLGILGWPGDQPLDSREYQVFTAFQVQLEEFASLDGFSGDLSAAQAQARFARLLAEQRFQPRGQPAPVQVLGVLEAAALRFERLWVTGMSDQQWPAPAPANPFLPLALQREQAMPGADPQAELMRAGALTRELLGAAPQVWVSHARQVEDQHQRISPLLEHLANIDPEAVPQAAFAGPVESLAQAGPRPESIIDTGPSALAPGTRARGGSAALKDQAACPFRAVAHYRLGAVRLETAASPIDARVRGLLAHRLLQRIWDRLRDSRTLAATADEVLEALLEEVATGTISEAARERPQAFSGRLRELESARLQRLARDWLELERSREPFQVMASEQRQILSIGGLSLDLRLDRVDRLGGGCLFLIDYKTGKVRTGGWLQPRPEDPQLPLYCLLFEFPGGGEPSPLAGLAFASLKRGALGFHGFADDPAAAPNLKPFGKGSLKAYPGIADLIALWHRDLEALAREFARGEARVDPRDGRRTCKYCDAGAFCRISDRRQDPYPDARVAGP